MIKLPTTKPKVASKRKSSPPPPPPTPAEKIVQAKTFTIGDWDSNGGERILWYGDTGIGKSSINLMAPKPVFLGLDEGAGRLHHPVTGKPPKRIENLETFADVRAALQQVDLFDSYETVVIDTVTILQDWAEPHMFATVPGPKGITVRNIEGYGYNKGYKHLYDKMKEILVDCDNLIRLGKHVSLIAQATPNRISNPGGEDFLRDGPRLYAGKPSIEALYCEWADHILRIAYQDSFVKEKKISGETTRAVFTQPEVYFRAKSRTISEPVVSFEDPADDSIWVFIMGADNESV